MYIVSDVERDEAIIYDLGYERLQTLSEELKICADSILFDASAAHACAIAFSFMDDLYKSNLLLENGLPHGLVIDWCLFHAQVAFLQYHCVDSSSMCAVAQAAAWDVYLRNLNFSQKLKDQNFSSNYQGVQQFLDDLTLYAEGAVGGSRVCSSDQHSKMLEFLSLIPGKNV